MTIGKGLAKIEPGSLHGLQLVVEDIAAARAELTGRGVQLSTIQHPRRHRLRRGPGRSLELVVFFSDPDGNGWAIQERPSA